MKCVEIRSTYTMKHDLRYKRYDMSKPFVTVKSLHFVVKFYVHACIPCFPGKSREATHSRSVYPDTCERTQATLIERIGTSSRTIIT